MSLEAMQFLAAAEENVRQMKASSAAAAKKRIADTRLAGEAMLEEAMKKAERELDELSAAANEEAKKSAHELAAKNEASKSGMRAAAETKMAEAVSFIVERIVKS